MNGSRSLHTEGSAVAALMWTSPGHCSWLRKNVSGNKGQSSIVLLKEIILASALIKPTITETLSLHHSLSLDAVQPPLSSQPLSHCYT